MSQQGGAWSVNGAIQAACARGNTQAARLCTPQRHEMVGERVAGPNEVVGVRHLQQVVWHKVAEAVSEVAAEPKPQPATIKV